MSKKNVGIFFGPAVSARGKSQIVPRDNYRTNCISSISTYLPQLQYKRKFTRIKRFHLACRKLKACLWQAFCRLVKG